MTAVTEAGAIVMPSPARRPAPAASPRCRAQIRGGSGAHRRANRRHTGGAITGLKSPQHARTSKGPKTVRRPLVVIQRVGQQSTTPPSGIAERAPEPSSLEDDTQHHQRSIDQLPRAIALSTARSPSGPPAPRRTPARDRVGPADPHARQQQRRPARTPKFAVRANTPPPAPGPAHDPPARAASPPQPARMDCPAPLPLYLHLLSNSADEHVQVAFHSRV